MPAVALIFALLLALSAQFMWHILLVEHPAVTTAQEIILYLLFSAGLIAFARMGLRWVGALRWAGATAFAVTLLFLPWWGLSIAEVFDYARPLWLILVRLTGLTTVVLIALMSLRKLVRS